jgi:hypothetical protein
MTDQDMKNMEMLLQRYVGTVYEDFQSKLDLVVEGQLTLHQEIHDTRTELKQDIELCNFKIDTLNTKIDNVEEKLTNKIDGVSADLKATDDRLSEKIDDVEARLTEKIGGVAVDLKAHRADTEMHHGVYGVKE